jgi:hypothetical protein
MLCRLGTATGQAELQLSHTSPARKASIVTSNLTDLFFDYHNYHLATPKQSVLRFQLDQCGLLTRDRT